MINVLFVLPTNFINNFIFIFSMMSSYSSKLVNSKSRKALEPFVEYVLDVYYNGVDEYGNQIEESSREESFERRWNKARAILLKSK